MKRTAFAFALGFGFAASAPALAEEPFSLLCETERFIIDNGSETNMGFPVERWYYTVAPTQQRVFAFASTAANEPVSDYTEIVPDPEGYWGDDRIEFTVTFAGTERQLIFNSLMTAPEISILNPMGPNQFMSHAGPCQQIANLGPIFGPVDVADLDAVGSWSRADVQQVQQMLEMLGYGAGVADGIAGSRTMAALAAFMTEQGLPADAAANAIATASARAIYDRDYGGANAEWTPRAEPTQTTATTSSANPMSRGEHVQSQCGQNDRWRGRGHSSFSSFLNEVMNWDPSTMQYAIDLAYDDGHSGYGSWLECVWSARQSYSPTVSQTVVSTPEPEPEPDFRTVHNQCFAGRRDGGGYTGTNTCGFPINLYYCGPMRSGNGGSYWDCGMRYALQNGWGHTMGTNMSGSINYFYAACEMDNIACNNRAHSWIQEIDQDEWRGENLNSVWASVGGSD
jgi:peptidoglycan hydrolase-like protein with peptidoglycan-binding domain